ncbi:hypothetical protein M758_1G301000 [Ceratodon purpureus]|nr:hypothetical protein M758_1G301000 [Ceratodon purpureus]
MFNEFVAVILSVTFVLAFGEVIPQAVCSRHGLAIGANFVGLVKVPMIHQTCWPISYPVGKILDHSQIGAQRLRTIQASAAQGTSQHSRKRMPMRILIQSYVHYSVDLHCTRNPKSCEEEAC